MLSHPGAQSRENIPDKRVAVPREPVMHPFSIALHLDQSGASHPGQVARDLRLIEAEGAMQIADAELAVGQKVEQTKTGGIGERFKEQLGRD